LGAFAASAVTIAVIAAIILPKDQPAPSPAVEAESVPNGSPEAVTTVSAAAPASPLAGQWVGTAQFANFPNVPGEEWDLRISNRQGVWSASYGPYVYGGDQQNSPIEVQGNRITAAHTFVDESRSDPKPTTFRLVAEASGDQLSGFETCEEEGQILWRKQFALNRKGAPVPELALFYHGSSFKNATDLAGNRGLTPQTLYGNAKPALDGRVPWELCTDFGKGLYTHLSTTDGKSLAITWAKLIACRADDDRWGVVVFRVPRHLLARIESEHKFVLYDRKDSRPANAPVVRGQPASWLELVEYDRHLRRGEDIGILRPDDTENWSSPDRAWIQGPIWVPHDSGREGGPPPFPDSIHQRNWLQRGLDDCLNPTECTREVLSGAVADEIARILGLSAEGFQNAPPTDQQLLLEYSKMVCRLQGQVGRDMLAHYGIVGDVITRPKRDNLGEFVKVVVKKASRRDAGGKPIFSTIGEMPDIVSGRFNLPLKIDVEQIASAFRTGSFVDYEVLQIDARGPRWHALQLHKTARLKFEWQINTRRVSEFFEAPGIQLPTGLDSAMKGNLHDVDYVVFGGIKIHHPDDYERWGLAEFQARVKAVAHEAADRGDDMPRDELDLKIQALHGAPSVPRSASWQMSRIVEEKGGIDYILELLH